MESSDLEAMMKRHAAGDRDPDLLNELTRRAWAAFHDPWEEAEKYPSAVMSLGRLPIDSTPYDPDKPEKLDVATLGLFVGMHCSSHLKRKSWPFFVTYDYLADPEPERCPRILMESPDGRRFVCSFIRNLNCEDADIPRVQEFCRSWNASRPWPEAKLVEPLGSRDVASDSQRIISLELEVTLAEENPSITLTHFNQMMKELIKATSEFWNMLSRDFEP